MSEFFTEVKAGAGSDTQDIRKLLVNQWFGETAWAGKWIACVVQITLDVTTMADRKIPLPKLRKSLSATMVALSLVYAAGGADAALVTGRFDPDFGGTLTGTGYEGTATFSIADSCLALLPTSGAFVYSSYDCAHNGGDAGMKFLGAHIDFYDTISHLVLGSADFAADPLLGPSSVLGMYVENGQVTGVQTNVLGAVTSNLLDGNGDPYSFLLLFGMTNPIIGNDEGHDPGNDNDGDLDDQAPSVFQQTRLFRVTDGSCTPGNITSCEQSNIANTTYVPEPGSAALVLAALLAAGAVRRRVS